MTTRVSKELDSIGDWVLIGTQEASNDALITQTGLNSDYDIYCLIGSSIVLADDGEALKIRFGDSSGIDSGASDYVSHRQVLVEGSTSYGGADFSTPANQIHFAHSSGTGAGEGISFIAWIMNPGDAGTFNTIFGQWSCYTDAPALQGGTMLGMREAAITLDRVAWHTSGGNITSGRFTIWGLPHE